jgi:STE24 endopeptidase
MTPTLLLWIIVAMLVASFLFNQWLDYLNLRNHQREIPAPLADRLDAEKYARAHDYHAARYRFDLVSGLLSFGILLLVLLGGGFGWLDDQLRTVTTHPIGLSLLFFGVMFIVSDLAGLPFQLYSTFVIEQKFGFNKTTPRLFFMDKLKSYALGIVFGGIVMGALVALINLLGSGFWIWFWGFITLFMLFVNVFYTSLIVPLFNQLKPLEAGELRERIERYSEQVGFPLDNIFVIDGSRRSAKSNAYFSGLGKRKKVVLYDTLIENHGQDELVAVLAHEVGHYKKNHIRQGLVLSVLQTGMMLFVLSRFVESNLLGEALGASNYGIHLSLIAFGLLYSPISMVLGMGMNLFSRKNEFEADHFAATTFASAPLQEALIRLHADNLSNLTPHPLYVFINYSHPPLLARLAALEA